ncbi:Bug family tripartite tricarboxylate transporter substrate binding protein [Lacisediminimonas profundi]|uniref:Bug family tripartite tricarboxylate transporter substrate binding protein n=1 Tax=Lacisediminimonas profundi TaxID=2603856 RepID=UPI001F4FE6C8|nr:tripartite tricarboxylate transporter substrate binding protein [Lacisediminimonas profundi]
MRTFKHSLLTMALGLAVSFAGLTQAHAADPFPSKPIRIIAPSSPGGILDLTSRLVGKKLSDQLKHPVVIENMPGAGGIIGVQGMLRAEPDGHTMVMGSLGPNAANYTLRTNLPYTMADFAPVINVLSMPNVLVVNPKLPVTNLAQFKAYAATKPGGLSMAISTSGSSGHLAGELLKIRLQVPAVNVIYKGAAPALTDLIAGQVDFMVDNMITALPHIKAGKLRAIAVTTKARSVDLPDVPGLAELGYPDIDVGVWVGLLVSSKTPPAIVEKLNVALNAVLADPEIRATFAKQGGVAVGGSAADFDKFIRAEKDRWEKVITTAKLKPD